MALGELAGRGPADLNEPTDLNETATSRIGGKTTGKTAGKTSGASLSRLAAAALLALLMLFAAACGSDDAETATEEADVESVDTVDASTEDAAAAADEPAAEEPAPEPTAEPEEAPVEETEEEEDGGREVEGSPIEEAFGFGDFDDSESLVEMNRRMERAVQSCMANQGFEYEINESSGAFFEALGAGEDLSEEEYAAQYGFGISTLFDQQFSAPEELTEIEDPNFARMATMSNSERTAYEAALFGQQPDFDPVTGQPIDPETGEPTDDFSVFMQGGGCFNEAQTESFGNFQVLIELESEFRELEARILADPRVVELASQYSECMAERGYDAENPISLERDLVDEFNEFTQDLFFAAPPQEPPAEGEEGDFPSGPELSPEQEARLAELQEKERGIAIANLACDDGITEQVEEYSREYEEAFLEENADAVARFQGDN